MATVRNRRCSSIARLAWAVGGCLRRLGHDRAGNTIIMVAAAILPLMALIGSGVDMGRSYLVQSRLQRACDAGALSARKTLATFSNFDVDTDQAKIDDAGDRFFNVNFPDELYGTQDRRFDLTVADDLSIKGTASVVVPTTIMRIFNFDSIPVSVDCAAQLTNTDTDVVMALDVTGSMNETLAGDTQSKISALKAVVKSFYASMEANKVAGARMRFGFVPYSTNVNSGSILKDDWVAANWTYDSRTLNGSGTTSGTYSFWTATSPVSGTSSTSIDQTYQASWDGGTGKFKCNGPPLPTAVTTYSGPVTTTSTVTGPPSGTMTTQTYQRTRNGDEFSVALSGTLCTVTKTTYSKYVDTYAYVTMPGVSSSNKWDYKPVTKSTSGWRTASSGCMEERATYEITDYDNVDLSQALDLDIDGVPVAGDAATQWKPEYPGIIYERALEWSGLGGFTTASVLSTNKEFVAPALIGVAACPAPAKKLQEWTSSDLSTYINSLSAGGSTYHDIGMLWAGRIISPNGLFADENADNGRNVSRNVIFLTDGQTSTLDLSYGAYGVEPLAQRRWNPTSALTLNQTVEKRFTFACDQVKNRNVTVWFIAFGTALNPIMTDCAGPGHYFSAANSTELNAAFAQIAKNIGDLRLQQ